MGILEGFKRVIYETDLAGLIERLGDGRECQRGGSLTVYRAGLHLPVVHSAGEGHSYTQREGCMVVLRLISFVFIIFSVLSNTISISSEAADRGIRIAETKSSPKTDGRTALVIGNGAYDDAPLKNPVNDARAVASTLGKLGFHVIEKENLNMAQMLEAIQQFGKRIRQGGVGLFYFAGHGVQFQGENYLIPVRSGIEFEEHIRYRAVNIGEVLAEMEVAKNGLNILILDACRNNPFKRTFRSSSSGLANVNAPIGTLIAYATAPGSVAQDGEGKNGLYTQELIKNMSLRGLKVEDVFKRVRVSVQEHTKNQQVPWESSSLVGDFYFSPPSGNQPPITAMPDLNLPDSQMELPAPSQSLAYAPTDSNQRQVALTAEADQLKSFLGKWDGEWKSDNARQTRTRPCKLTLYNLDGQLYADFFIGKAGFSHSIGFDIVDEKKLKAEILLLKGVRTLAFTLQSGREFDWVLTDGKLVCHLAYKNSTCTLSKTK